MITITSIKQEKTQDTDHDDMIRVQLEIYATEQDFARWLLKYISGNY